MNKDPTGSELLAAAREAASAIGADELEVGEAAYWFANHHNEGQYSNLYKALTELGCRPGPTRSGPEKGSATEAIYDALCVEFTGKSPAAIQRWESRVRAAHACAAVRAYAKAKGEDADESSIVDLVSDLMHLKALVYGDRTESEQEKEIQRTLRMGESQATEERCGAAEYEQNTGLTMTDEQQCDLIEFIRETGAYDLDKIDKPEGA